jgi:hypothetical protein
MMLKNFCFIFSSLRYCEKARDIQIVSANVIDFSFGEQVMVCFCLLI